MILLFWSIKGGVGKTTLAVNCAVRLIHLRHSVALADADIQRSAAKWAMRRVALGARAIHVPATRGAPTAHLLRDLANMYDDVICDVSGRDGVESRAALLVADVVFIPLTPSQADVETLAEMLPVLDRARALNRTLDCRVVLNMTEPTRGQDELIDAADTLRGVPGITLADTRIARRKVYRQAMRLGYSVLESDNTKARAEIQLLCAELGADYA